MHNKSVADEDVQEKISNTLKFFEFSKGRQ